MIKGTVLHAGEAHGPTLVLTEPLSFWGAFDPRSGVIIDTHHPQCGAKLTGHILLLPETRGSGTAPGAVAEAIRLGTAPLGIIMITADINVAIGASVAGTLYGKSCPVTAVDAASFAQLVLEPALSIRSDGLITSREPRTSPMPEA
jgi:uncharacterized protein